MHDEIVKYSMQGTLSDSNIVQSKDGLVNFVTMHMRDEGLVPVIDIDPQFTLDYDVEHDYYRFALSMYGIYVGSEEAWKVSGVTAGKRIPIPTPQDKSKK